jgi:uncharacterized membrane protein (UPF0182 family)
MARPPFEPPFEPPRPFEGLRDLRIPSPPRRFWIGLGFVGAALLVIFITEPLVSFITENQWFAALGFQSVFLTRVGIQVWLFVAALLIAAAVAVGNVIVALRVRQSGGVLRAVGIRQRMLRTPIGAIGVASGAFLALIFGLMAQPFWPRLVLFLHSSPTSLSDPVYGLNVSFYLLTLPFLHFIDGWLLGLVFLTGLLVAGVYAWRGDAFDFHLSPHAVSHLSVLGGVLGLVIMAGTFLDRYDLLFGHDSVVFGPGYTDVHVRSGLTTARAGLAAILSLSLFGNAWLRQPRLVIGVVVTWFGVAILGGIYPALVERVQVQPAQLAQESPYIQREIAFTRHAYGLDGVQSKPYGGDAPLTAQAVADDQTTIDNLRLWDNSQIQETYSQLQSIRTYYSFSQIDLDRYQIDGRTQQVEISARELDQARLPAQAQNWTNQKLQFTHGYGVAASPVSAVVGEGLPDYVARDFPPQGPLQVTQPDIYFGEQTNDFVLVPSASREFDYPNGADDVRNSYSGGHGVAMAGGNRLLWSLRTGDFNMLISDQVQDRTQILYRRRVQDRVQAIAPFLQLRDEPYIVVVNGHLYWIQDAYTGAATYPYSQPFADPDPAAEQQNYLRNSVKVVVDAYDGSVSFYDTSPDDPIIRAYEDAFPGLLKPLSAMPAGLRAHLRVPPTLFLVQAEMYATYHISDPSVFFNREDIWDLPHGLDQATLQPYYVQLRLPGESQPEYLQIIPFTPLNKQNLVAWLAVRNDPEQYGQMVAFILPKDKVVLGPQQILNRIQAEPNFSRDRTLFNGNGSKLIEGNLLAVPISDSFLYFEPIYLKADSGGGGASLPELKRVILADATGQSLAYQTTLKDALDQLVGSATATAPPARTGQPPPTGAPAPVVTVSPQVAALTAQAIQHYNAAQDALKRGDLATYGNEMNQVGQLLQQIDAAEHSTGGSSPAPQPSP